MGKYEIEDLKKIIIQFTNKNNMSAEENTKSPEKQQKQTELLREIIKTEEIRVLRRNDEGTRPLFDRTDIKVNEVKFEIDYTKIPNNKDVNYNLSRESTGSQTTRAVSRLTEDTLEMLTKSKQGLSSVDLVKDYLEQLEGMRTSSVKDHTSRTSKRRRNNSSVSSYSNDSSFERYREQKDQKIYKKRSRKNSKHDLSTSRNISYHQSPKKSRKYSPDPSEVLKSIERTQRNSKKYFRSPSRRSLSTISSNETMNEYKDYLDRRSYDKYEESRILSKKKSDCRECRSKRQSCSYDKHDRHDKNKERRICTKNNYRHESHDRKSYKSKHKSERHDSYSRDGPAAEEDDAELKYHRYNAAMYAVSVILEIIRQHQ